LEAPQTTEPSLKDFFKEVLSLNLMNERQIERARTEIEREIADVLDTNKWWQQV
jgi:hypothetical protein